MKITFTLCYHTAWGESMHIVLHREGARPHERRLHVALTCTDGEHWHGEILLHLKAPLHLRYHYELRRGAQTLRREWQTVPRCLTLYPQVDTYAITDQWRDLPAESWRYTTGFTSVFFPQHYVSAPPHPFARTVTFYAQTPRPNDDEELGLCGNLPALGNWQPDQSPALCETQPNTWVVSLNAVSLSTPFEYKFFLRHKKTGCITWEDGPNRTLSHLPASANTTHIYHDLRPQFAPGKSFRAAGVVVPVFSLKSKSGAGVGDLGDLKLLVDWAVKTGQKVIQILPIHDTSITGTWTDSYPYNAISVYAFHPLYANVRDLPPTAGSAPKKWEEAARQLNDLPAVDYERALKLKLTRLHQAFDKDGEHTLGSAKFHHFFHQNAHWLPAYAMFCVLRDKYRTANFRTWPEHAVFSDDDLHRFCAPGTAHESQLHFWYYVQFILHTQLKDAADYARAHGVILKGDIPIGISPYSVEAWTQPRLFHVNAQAGAPPDDFSATGQNWGFPTYNWEEMARDNYRWWRGRLMHLARYFDAYRIDHVLGFFRIWEIPSSCVDGLLGQFSPALPLSRKEIESYGLPFKPSFLHPYITDKILKKYFGPDEEEVKKTFVTAIDGGLFHLRPAVDTQRKIEAALAGQHDAKTRRIKQGLFALCTQVLFVKDARRPHLFHPRIAALTSDAFDALTAQEKHAFTQLYNDFFFHRHDEFWKESALKKLPALTQSTRMLCCVEDLGMVPACVPDVMRQLQLLSLEIERMPKKSGEHFADIFKYPYLSVATPSTHDMSVLRAWWTENRAVTQAFWREVLGRTGHAPDEMSGEICEEILDLHLKSNSMLALIGWQDWLGMDEKLRAPDPEKERINVPADPRHYWRYRMHLTLEELLNADGFNEKIKEMIKNSGR